MDGSLKSKTRDKKINITDVAIQKVPYVEYIGLTKCQRDFMQHLAKRILTVSKEENNSNEVAVVVKLLETEVDKDYGLCYGDEHTVDILANAQACHIISSCTSCAVAILHNHPSTQTLSLWDIMFFLKYASVRIMIVVTNQGKIHYLAKTDKYDYKKAIRLLQLIMSDEVKKDDKRTAYIASLRFLSVCSEIGLYYN